MNILGNIRGLAMAGIVALAAMASSDAHAQASATGTASANAVIAKPITIVSTANLDFGTIVPNSTGNGAISVLVDTASTTPPTLGGVVDGAWLGGTISSAAFDVTGRPNATYAITVPAAAVTITGTNPANTMTVGSFTESTAGAGGTLLVGATPGLGEHNFTVGATLSVPEAQADDTYAGNFSVTVAYN